MGYHIYYQLKFTLLSPLAIGSGASENTDKDIIRDSSGNPVIPATAIAGILRSRVNDIEKNRYFGFIDNERNKQSPIIFYDAVCISQDDLIFQRDGVKLDIYKTAQNGAKFDFEIVKTGTEFIGYAEIDKNNSSECEDRFDGLFRELMSGQINLGGKSTRGYGKVKVEVRKIKFDIDSQVNDWLDFDMFAFESWIHAEPMGFHSITDDTVILLKLSLRGGISIREYSTDVYTDGDSAPDYRQMELDGVPVIPGTSWAGAFRHNISSLGASEDSINNAFGFVKNKNIDKTVNKDETVRSKISFGESRIYGGTSKIITRNSIDRFTAGTKDGALYTEKSHYGGRCELEIRLKKGFDETIRNMLAASICDLNNGFLAVGGLTAVGRGIFKVDGMSVNNVDVTERLNANDVGGMLNVR